MDGLAGPSAPATERGHDGGRATIHVRQIREILRQKWALGLSHRAVARSLGVGLGPISSVVMRVRGAEQGWLQGQPLSDDVLEGRLYGRRCCY